MRLKVETVYGDKTISHSPAPRTKPVKYKTPKTTPGYRSPNTKPKKHKK